jgi:hypothetical protein
MSARQNCPRQARLVSRRCAASRTADFDGSFSLNPSPLLCYKHPKIEFRINGWDQELTINSGAGPKSARSATLVPRRRVHEAEEGQSG